MTVCSINYINVVHYFLTVMVVLCNENVMKIISVLI